MSLSVREALEQVQAVLDEVERLDNLQKQHTADMADLARRARAGEKVQRPQQPTVVDYGDVWASLKRLRPVVKKALKSEKATDAR